MSRIALPLLLACAAALPGALAAQATFTLPTSLSTTSNNVPLGVGQCRYQQWFSAAEWVANQADPGRVDRVTVFAGPMAATTTTVDVQIFMAHAFAFGITGGFDTNVLSDFTQVFPRQSVLMTAGQNLTFNLPNRFTWNGRDAVLIEFRVYGNGQGGQPFTHDNISTTTGFGTTTRAFTVGDANATSALTVQPAWGLRMEFNTQLGANTDFGQGCPGAGGFVPRAVVMNGVGRPGLPWVHQVQQVSNGRLCFWTAGSDRQNSSAGALPLDLRPFGAAGCLLLHNLDTANVLTTSTGGGIGSSIGEVTIPIPPISQFVGLTFYSQWFVIDRGAFNGRLAASQGIWSIIAP